LDKDLIYGIIGIELLILIIFLVGFIIYARKMLRSIETFINTTQESLTPLLTELRVSVERLNKISERIDIAVKDIQHLTTSLGNIATLIDEINDFARKTGVSFSVKTASLGVGIKTALSALAKGILKKGGDTDEQ
jgi:uncharacterized protein YoxC